MTPEERLKQIRDALINLDIDACVEACRLALSDGISPLQVIEGMSNGMTVIGEKFQSKEYFLSELIMAGEVMREGMEVVKPHLAGQSAQPTNKIVLGTVRGDLHDIGKNIVSMLLTAAGFQVIDLGVDVSAEAFVEAVRRNSAHLVGMSALLTVTLPEISGVVKQLEESGLRNQLKIVIGGAATTPELERSTGADYTAKDAVDGVNRCKVWSK